MSISHLRIQTSTIPGAGKGLFALDRSRPHRQVLFHANAIICEYGGEILDEDEKDERYEDKTAPYAVRINRNRYEDGATERGVGSLANEPPRGRDANARLALYNVRGGNGRVRLIAESPIRNGDEIFVEYGEEYGMAEPGVHYSTTSRR